MNTPLCNFCIKSNMLCPSCEEKVKTGKVSDTDIKIAKLFLELESKYQPLQNITFFNSYEYDYDLIVVLGKGDLNKINEQRGKIVRSISDKINKKIHFLEKYGGVRKFLEDLFSPLSIIAINKILLPDGTTETRVVLEGYKRQLPMSSKILSELAKNIRGITLRIAFEDQEIGF